MARIYCIDVAVPNDKRRKLHVVFDGERTFGIRKLTELKDASEVFIDTLNSKLYDEILELLKKDVKVFLLRGTKLIKRLREENGLRKSDEVDARLLGLFREAASSSLHSRR
jgi:hypothetical protein